MKRQLFCLSVLIILLVSCRNSQNNNVLESPPQLSLISSYSENLSQELKSPEMDFYNNGCRKLNLSPNPDYVGAIQEFSKTLEKSPTFYQAYHNRAYAKQNDHDFIGAVADYNKELELKKINFTSASDWNDIIYNDRGVAKYNLQDYRGAISDFESAIKIQDKLIYRLLKINSLYQIQDFQNAIFESTLIIDAPYQKLEKREAYFWRGLALIQIGKKESGCLDLSKSGEMGFLQAYESIKKYCQ